MTISDKVTLDLLTRIKKMTLEECRRMEENLPSDTGDIDKAIMAMLQDRIAQLHQEEVIDCG